MGQGGGGGWRAAYRPNMPAYRVRLCQSCPREPLSFSQSRRTVYYIRRDVTPLECLLVFAAVFGFAATTRTVSFRFVFECQLDQSISGVLEIERKIEILFISTSISNDFFWGGGGGGEGRGVDFIGNEKSRCD